MRRETKKFIDKADFKTVHALLEAEQESGWWDDLTPEASSSINRGLKEAAEGKTISHEAVMKKYKKWRLK